MMTKLHISLKSIFEILGIYSLILTFQAFSLYLIGNNAHWTIYLNYSFFLLEPENYRAIWALLYVCMTIAIWLDCKINNKIITTSTVLCLCQITLTAILHYMFFLNLDANLVFYGAILVNFITMAIIYKLSCNSYIVAAFIIPHLFWSIFLIFIIY